MAGDWTRYEVQELISSAKLVVGDGYRAKNSELTRAGLPFARAGNVNSGFLFDDTDCFPERDIARVGNKISQPGDVVFTSKGTVGRFAFVRKETRRFVYSPQLCFWRSLDANFIDPYFLYFWMLGVEFFNQFKGVAGQTDMAEYVSLTDQRRMHITLPPLTEQRAIAHILGALEDKIELNRRMNETLEAMARALFKSWFVDFDPVRAKINGSEIGLPKDASDLFPDSIVDSELGTIPNGWSVHQISELAEIVGGSTPSTQESAYWEDGIHAWATPKDLSSLSVPVLLGTERRITDAGLLQIGSGLLPVGSVLLSSRAPIGYLAITEIPVAINQGFIAMKPKANVSNLFLLLWAAVAQDEIVSRANGSTFLEISKSSFRPIPVAVPDGQVMAAFEKIVRPIYQRIVCATRDATALAKTRDSLLPKLISGEVRLTQPGVQRAEPIVAEDD
jgi:type I restriction enzyme S subunit